MDIELPDMNGILAVNRIQTLHPSASIVLMSIHHGSSIEALALCAGATAFVSKRELRRKLIPVLESALRASRERSATPAWHHP